MYRTLDAANVIVALTVLHPDAPVGRWTARRTFSYALVYGCVIGLSSCILRGPRTGQRFTMFVMFYTGINSRFLGYTLSCASALPLAQLEN